MWKDSKENRCSRYREILKKSPHLFSAAVCQEKKACENGINSMGEEDSEDGLDEVCRYVLAPALHGYVSWVLDEAVKSGKQRLYFLARDGYMMYQAAREMTAQRKLPIECVYLSCSRYSIRIPMYHMDFEQTLDFVCRGGIDVTMHKIFARAALTEDEQMRLLDELQKSDLPTLSIHEKLSYASLSKIRAALENNTYFRTCVDAHSRAALPNLEGYLAQEGLLDDIPCALVDSGWVGSMQQVLNHLLLAIRENRVIEKPQYPLEGYYWGLYELPTGVNPKQYHCYYFSPGDRIREKVYFSNCLFESIFSAPHGMTLGYRSECESVSGELPETSGAESYPLPNAKKRFTPVYAIISLQQRDFMQRIARQMQSYTEAFLGTYQKTEFEADRKVISALLHLFMGEPSRWEAEAFGSLGFSDDVLDEEGGNRQVADLLNEKELTANHAGRKILAMCGIGNKYVRESAWYEGSAVRSGVHVKRHLRRYAAYKYLLYLRKRHIWRKIYG